MFGLHARLHVDNARRAQDGKLLTDQSQRLHGGAGQQQFHQRMFRAQAVYDIAGFVADIADAIAVAVPAQIIAPVIAIGCAPVHIAGADIAHLFAIGNKVVATDLIVFRARPKMHASLVVDHQIIAQCVVFRIVDKETAGIAGNNIIFDDGILNRAQHDAVIGIGPGAVVAHDDAAHFHQRQAAAVHPRVVVFPDVVVGVHVVRAVAAVMQPVAAEQRRVGDIDVERVAHEADVVAGDPRAMSVVELDAVAALRRLVFALAGDQVVLDADIVSLFDPQPEEVVGEIAVPHHGTMRAGK